MNRSQLLDHLKDEVYCRLKPSSFGVGVVAIRDIPKGCDPFNRCWNGDYIPLTDEELSTLSLGVQEMVKDYCVFDEGVWFVPDIGLNSLDISFFINHSDQPNVTTDDGITFKASRLIKEGEELLVDYNTYSEGL